MREIKWLWAWKDSSAKENPGFQRSCPHLEFSSGYKPKGIVLCGYETWEYTEPSFKGKGPPAVEDACGSHVKIELGLGSGSLCLGGKRV